MTNQNQVPNETENDTVNTMRSIIELEEQMQSLERALVQLGLTPTYDQTYSRDFAGTLRLNAMALAKKLTKLSNHLQSVHKL